jgi:hypothetical protein
MITMRPAAQHGSDNLGWLDSRHTFSFGHYYEPNHMGFGPLRVINEDRVRPGAGFDTQGHRAWRSSPTSVASLKFDMAGNRLLAELAADLVRRQVVVIAATSGVSPTLAARAATTTIPIVSRPSEHPFSAALIETRRKIARAAWHPDVQNAWCSLSTGVASLARQWVLRQ